MKIAFFASSLVSAYWNGAATYYRGIVRALADRGHRITFYEPDAFERQQHRDIADPPWAEVVVYPSTLAGVHAMIERARGADLVIKASGIGVHDELLEAAVLELQGPRTLVAFWDVDAPATLDRLAHRRDDPFHALVPKYDLVLTYGGGPPVVTAYEARGARRCVPIYNALDPTTHHPAPRDPRFAGALGFLGNRLPDREARVGEMFLRAASLVPHERFLLGGAGWDHLPRSGNVAILGHIYTRDHNAFNSTPRAVLNISRESMATYGFWPAPRVFEAAGAGACVITDAWVGIEQFLEPGREILVARDGDEVAAHVEALAREPARAGAIGARARTRMLSEHTYAHRAVDLERALGISRLGSSTSTSTSTSTTTKMNVIVLGLSITSSWDNHHATTYRGLVRELVARGHDVMFLERDVPAFADHRDLAPPPHGRTALYRSTTELFDRFTPAVRAADAVIVGSHLVDGIALGRWVQDHARGVTAFYDLDTPVTLAALETSTCEYLSRELVPGYQLYLSFTGGPTLARIERQLGSPRARALYGSVDPELHRPEQRARCWELGYLGTYSADRQPVLQALLVEPARRAPERKFAVAGPQYPDAIEWPANVQRIEYLAASEHRAFHSECAYTLNITRRDLVAAGWSPSVRLFEAAACGVPIISDAWDGLDELFAPDREILIARDGDDVLRILRDVSESARAALGARGRTRVLASHTASHRAGELEALIAELRR